MYDLLRLAGPPNRGRVLSGHRRVRSGDADANRVLRLDGVARYAQDIAFDDLFDAAEDGDHGAWVLRRTVIEVHRMPVFHDQLRVRTWCSGIGARWCTKRTTLDSADGARVEVEGFWVNVDPTTGRPASLSARMVATFREAAGDAPLRWRRMLTQAPPADPAPSDGGADREFALRLSDVDWLGHLNNATYWSALEQVLAGHTSGPVEAVLEHAVPVDPGERLRLRTSADGATQHVWFLVDGAVRAVARVRPRV